MNQVMMRWHPRPAERLAAGRYVSAQPAGNVPTEPVSVRGFVEMTAKYDAAFLRDMVLSAYAVSRNGLVTLALNGVTSMEIDRILDPLVQANGWGVGNLRYQPGHLVDHALLAEAAQADFVIVHSTQLAAALFSRGTRYMGAHNGLYYLDRLADAGEAKAASPLSAMVTPSPSMPGPVRLG